MATDFPSSLDSYTDPLSTDKLNNPSHSTQHQNHNDSIEAIEAKLGIGASTPTANKVLRATGTGTTSYGQVDVTTDVASFTSANLRTLLSDETGTGAAVFATSPTITTPTIASFTNANHDHTNSAGGGTLGSGSVSSSGILATGVVTSPKEDTELQKGWQSHYGGTQFPAPSTVTYNGNRSYDLVFNSVDLTSAVSVGQRLKLTRSVTAPTQCTDLEASSSQYYSKSSPAGMTFTDDFVVSAWVKLESYANSTIASRYNGTSGWVIKITSTGIVSMEGYNGGSGNVSYMQSYQSVPLGKWVHVAAQLDMSTFTATTTTSYVMLDGVDVPVQVLRAGTNPTALVQAGNLEIGGQNGGQQPFDGKLAQVAIYSAKVTQATILASMNQTLTGSETSLISAYSFNNSINDLNTTNANNLTANGGAVATNADSPFGIQADGTTAGTTEYAIITKTAFSTNTTLTVQVPEGNAIPTSGGVSAVSYSTQKVPYGFPASTSKWRIYTLLRVDLTQASPTQNVWYNLTTTTGVSGGSVLNIPVGEWNAGYEATGFTPNGTNSPNMNATLSTASNTESNTEMSCGIATGLTGANAYIIGLMARRTSNSLALTTATPYYLNVLSPVASTASINLRGATNGAITIYAELALL